LSAVSPPHGVLSDCQTRAVTHASPIALKSSSDGVNVNSSTSPLALTRPQNNEQPRVSATVSEPKSPQFQPATAMHFEVQMNVKMSVLFCAGITCVCRRPRATFYSFGKLL
jgi:hypothetical protein